MTSDYSKTQLLKRRFFAMRNGIVADCIRRAGAPYRIVFGLNLPQINEISRSFGPDPELAREMWANSSTRESVLIAPMLMPVDEFSREEALRWAVSVPSAEAADILCLKLLKHCKFAANLVGELADSSEPLVRYVALRLAMNLLPTDLDSAELLAKRELEKNERATLMVARQIVDEVEFLREESSGS